MWEERVVDMEKERCGRKESQIWKRENVRGKSRRYGKGKMWEERVADVEKGRCEGKSGRYWKGKV